MITLHDFKQAYQQYHQGHFQFRLIQEQAAILINLCDSPEYTFNAPQDISHAAIQWLLNQEQAAFDYQLYFGGYMHVCESEQDLKQIKGCDFAWAEAHGDWPNVTDLAMSWDVCSYLPERDGDPQWVQFNMCWNNAGGDTYFVHKHLWAAARIHEHIALTTQSHS